MQNIVILLQIISFFIIIFFLISKNRKDNIKIIIPVLIFLLASVWYYHVPRNLREFSEMKYLKDSYISSIDLDQRDDIHTYNLLDKDHEVFMNLMKDLKYSPTKINVVQTGDNVRKFLILNEYGVVVYTIVFDLNDNKSLLLSSDSKRRDYNFTISKDLKSYIEDLHLVYNKAIEDKNQQPHLDYSLEIVEGDTNTYKYKFDDAYILTDLYLYTTRKSGGRGWTGLELKTVENGYIVEFSYKKDYLIENIVKGGMKLQIRGEYNNLPFQKEIIVY